MLIKNYLHQLGCSWHRVCCTSFARAYRNFKLFKNFAAPFPKYNIDATGAQSEVNCFLAGGEVLLTLFGPAESSTNRTALLCGNTAYCSLVCERPGPCYRGAVFLGDDLAVQGSPCSCAADGQGAMVAPVRPGRQPHPLGSIDQHE
jgi:hypothetical protein